LTITEHADQPVLERSLKAKRLNASQPFYVSEPLKQTGRVMVKDENLCVHCGLCAERCPTGAWDMQKSTVSIPYALDEARQTEKSCRQTRKAG
jgi:NAD-dependent dihydropyrimidine dehydrogenase PreA subunit